MNHLAGGFVAVGLGAMLGAWLRWGLGMWLNPRFPAVPLGTLTANLVGGYLVGIAVAWISARPEIDPAWRLFIVTGFLGGLTTFSTFSVEVVAQLMAGRMMWALSAIAVHVAGSIGMTLLGIGTVVLLRHSQLAGA